MDFRKLWSLALMGLKHPSYIWPTYTATRQCIDICNRKFGELHHKNGPENAFRHALWNSLIIYRSLQAGRELEKATYWAKKATDWHEEFSPNEPLARAMDLHNNKVGRDLMQMQPNLDAKTMIDALLLLLQKSEYIDNLDKLKMYKKHLLETATVSLIHIEKKSENHD
ncbi:MAG: hypothetical protein CL867_03645 [Cytophagaceae bacterium]|jgi:hypothetical protein|nr:hypothetical protein [Cytophagaceae bacterium]